MLILVNLGHFWYSQKILRDPVFISVLVRVKSTTHLCDHNTPELAVKGVFTPKIAKNWIFERGALKIEQNGGQICGKKIGIVGFQNCIPFLDLYPCF